MILTLIPITHAPITFIAHGTNVSCKMLMKWKSKSSRNSQCAICLQPIVDESDTHDSEDSIFCEGKCQEWIHWTCAGLSEAAFDSLHQSGNPFWCYHCHLSMHSSEVATLHTMINLTKELDTVKSQLSSLKSSVPPTGQTDSTITPSPPPINSAAPVIYASPGAQATHPSTLLHNKDRKFNLVMFGVPESPTNTPCMARLESDEQSVTNAIQLVQCCAWREGKFFLVFSIFLL